MLKTIKLRIPVEFKGRTVTEIVFKRRAKARDMIKARKGSASDEEAQLKITADVCEIEPEVLEELDGADYKEVCDFLNSFFI